LIRGARVTTVGLEAIQANFILLQTAISLTVNGSTF